MTISNVIDGAGNGHSAPTLGAVVFATALVAGVTGYYIGMGASVGVFSPKDKEQQQQTTGTRQSIPASDSESEDDDSSDEEVEPELVDDDEKLELATFENNRDEVKLVLVVRTDLGMTKGERTNRRFIFPYIYIYMYISLL